MNIILNRKIKYIFVATVVIIIGFLCNRDGELIVIQDDHYFIPEYRAGEVLNGHLFHTTSKRLFVFNYKNNESEFDSLSKQMMCDEILGELPLKRIYFDFQDAGRTFRKKEEIGMPSAMFTSNIISYRWELENKNLLYSEKDGGKKGLIRKFTEFECKFDKKYDGLGE